MQRVKRSTAVAVLPTPPSGGTPGYFAKPNPAGGQEATVPGYEWFNGVQEELIALIADAGLTPSDADLSQITKAVRTAIQKNAAAVCANTGSANTLRGAYSPEISALVGGMTLYLRAAAANTSTSPSFSPNYPTIADKIIVKGNNLPLAAGDIAGDGHWLELQYDAPLDRWVLQNPATGVSQPSVAVVQGLFKNLAASATGTNATVTVSADEIVVEDTSNTYKTLRAVSLSINSAGSGANGLDTGSIAASTWYSVWVIHNPTTQTTAGLLSLSQTAPTMPSGYTYRARVGWVRTDATGDKYPLSFSQAGRNTQYKVAAGSNLTLLPQMVSGVQGTYGTTLVAVAVGNYVPPTASRIRGTAFNGGTNIQVSPNSVATTVGTVGIFNTLAANQDNKFNFDFALESTNIYYASPAASAAVHCVGWEDNL